MLRGKVVTVFALCLAALASGMPQNNAVTGQQSSTSVRNTNKPDPALPDPLPAVSEVAGKVTTISKTLLTEPVPIVPVVPDQVKNVPAVFTKEVTVLHPKRVFRKRFWTPRKQIIYTIPAEVQEPEAAHSQNIARRQTTDFFNTFMPGARQQEQKPNQNDGNYDDIFNIPVSTLNAVNRLLNNNAG